MTNPTLPECDLVISGGRVLDLSASSGVLDDMAIAVRDGVIVGMGTAQQIEASFTAARVIDATGQVVAPGFVDAHVHLGAFLGVGRPYEPSTGPGLFSGGGRPEVVVPMVARMVSTSVPGEVVAAVVRPVLAAMLRAGFTAVVDAGGPGVDGVVSAAAELGIRAAIGPSLADMWHDEHGRLTRQADAGRLLDQARAAVDRHDQAGHGRVRAVVSGVETMACSDELLAGMAELSASRDVPMHLHTHITDASVRAHDAAFGRTATRRLADSGMLNQRCTLMHAGSLSDDDIAVFAETGVTVNYNPSGNAMLGFGTTAGRSVPRLLAAGVPVVLGSDCAPSTVSTPFEMVRAALMLQRDVAAADNALIIEQSLAMASTTGACLGRPGQLGRIAVGHLADLVLVDATGLHHLGADHPVPALGLRARAADVSTVIVDGRVVVEQGIVAGMDESALADQARHALAIAASHS
ncbi:MAG: amidohydrolase family protein [Pseudonocardia sp.]|nr:amidohydrolase family protein [Pseudonocardia sp.]